MNPDELSPAQHLHRALAVLNSTAREKVVRLWLLTAPDVDAAEWRRLVETERKRRQRAAATEPPPAPPAVPPVQKVPAGQNEASVPPVPSMPAGQNEASVPLVLNGATGQDGICPAASPGNERDTGTTPEAGKESGFPPGPPSGKETPGKGKENPPTEGKKKRKAAPAFPGAESVPVPPVLAAVEKFPAEWTTFQESRRLIKAPMTALAAERILARLAERPHDAVEALSLCVERQWQSFSWRYLDNEREEVARHGGGRNGHGKPQAERSYAEDKF